MEVSTETKENEVNSTPQSSTQLQEQTPEQPLNLSKQQENEQQAQHQVYGAPVSNEYTQQPQVPNYTQQPYQNAYQQNGYPNNYGVYGYQQPQYSQYQYSQQAYTQQQQQPGVTISLVGLILSILSIICCGPFTAIPGLICSIIGLVKSKSNGKAIAGIVISIVSLILWLFLIFAGLLSLGSLDNTIDTNYNGYASDDSNSTMDGYTSDGSDSDIIDGNNADNIFENTVRILEYPDGTDNNHDNIVDGFDNSEDSETSNSETEVETETENKNDSNTTSGNSNDASVLGFGGSDESEESKTINISSLKKKESINLNNFDGKHIIIDGREFILSETTLKDLEDIIPAEDYKEYAETEVYSGSVYDVQIFLGDKNNYNRLQIGFINNTNKTITLADCILYDIQYSSNWNKYYLSDYNTISEENILTFDIGSNLTQNMTLEDTIDVLGEPDYKENIPSDYIEYEWKSYSEKEGYNLKLEFYSETGLTDIYLVYYDYSTLDESIYN